MPQIKSALEIALEKTKDLKVDHASIEERETIQQAKKIAGEFLESQEETDLTTKIASFPKDKTNTVREAIIDVFLSRLQLPMNEHSLSNLERLGKGFGALNTAMLGEKKIAQLFQKLSEFFKQYLDDSKNLDAAIRKQFAPKLKQKEQEMAMRLGQAVRIDPMNDPEFVAVYRQNAGKLKSQYQAALDQAKDELAQSVGKKP